MMLKSTLPKDGRIGASADRAGPASPGAAKASPPFGDHPLRGARIVQWGHDTLASDLARRLRDDGKVWTWMNIAIGAWSGARPDIMAFPRWRYDVPQIHAYEIKVARGDLLSDLNNQKWRKYLEHCQSVTFAMPHRLATKDEIPAECGVMFRTGRGWRTERRPTNIGASCSIQAMAKLLTCHPAREPYPGLSKWEADALARIAREKFMMGAGNRYGRALARLAADVADGEDPAGKALETAEKIIASAKADAEGVRRELAPVIAMLGLRPDADGWSIAQKIRRVKNELSADGRAAQVEAALAQARAALDAAAQGIEAAKPARQLAGSTEGESPVREADAPQ